VRIGCGAALSAGAIERDPFARGDARRDFVPYVTRQGILTVGDRERDGGLRRAPEAARSSSATR
jgi:hypothetical protein